MRQGFGKERQALYYAILPDFAKLSPEYEDDVGEADDYAINAECGEIVLAHVLQEESNGDQGGNECRNEADGENAEASSAQDLVVLEEIIAAGSRHGRNRQHE